MSDRPLSILQLFVGSVPGGVCRYVADVSAALRRHGCRVLIAGQAGAWHPMIAATGCEWLEVPIRGGAAGLWRSAAAIRERLRGESVDVIHAHHRRATLVARIAQRPRGGRVPLLYTLHLTGIPMSWPWRMLSDFGDHAHAPSEQARRWLFDVGRMAPSRVSLVPHGIDPGRFHPATDAGRREARRSLRVPEDGVIAAYVGRLEHPKNEDWLVDLADEGRRRGGAGFTLLVAGDGPGAAEMRRRVDALGLGTRVRMLGHQEPVPVYHAADALLLPSALEGFSYACAEAMSCGVPVLRTRTAGTQELIVEGVTGRSVPIDRRAFVDAGVQFLSDPGALATMGRAAAQHVREHFTFEQQIDRTLALYRQLAGRQA